MCLNAVCVCVLCVCVSKPCPNHLQATCVRRDGEKVSYNWKGMSFGGIITRNKGKCIMIVASSVGWGMDGQLKGELLLRSNKWLLSQRRTRHPTAPNGTQRHPQYM